jgi:hypothetical protein
MQKRREAIELIREFHDFDGKAVEEAENFSRPGDGVEAAS